MNHDPLCVTPYKQQATCASCVLVARVRAAERGKAHAHSTGTDTGGPCCECCYEVNQGPCSHDLTLHDEKIRADEREQWATHEAVQSSHIGMLLREAAHADAFANLRAKVLALALYDETVEKGPDYHAAVTHFVALIDEAQNTNTKEES